VNMKSKCTPENEKRGFEFLEEKKSKEINRGTKGASVRKSKVIKLFPGVNIRAKPTGGKRRIESSGGEKHQEGYEVLGGATGNFRP